MMDMDLYRPCQYSISYGSGGQDERKKFDFEFGFEFEFEWQCNAMGCNGKFQAA